jgi:hypothetical protein
VLRFDFSSRGVTVSKTVWKVKCGMVKLVWEECKVTVNIDLISVKGLDCVVHSKVGPGGAGSQGIENIQFFEVATVRVLYTSRNQQF